MPFTVEDFFAVFGRYNQAIWPLQIGAYVIGVAIVILLFRRSHSSSTVIALALSALWLVNGVGYHWLFFAQINPVARGFAAVFVVQAVLLAAAPWLYPRLSFAVRADARSVVGLALIVFAAVGYPLWGVLAGHSYPFAPVFGVAPCPTTIFSVGVLLMGNWRTVRWLLIIPAIWSAIGGSAAVLLHTPQDFGLIATLVIVLAFYLGHWRGLPFASHAKPAH